MTVLWQSVLKRSIWKYGWIDLSVENSIDELGKSFRSVVDSGKKLTLLSCFAVATATEQIKQDVLMQFAFGDNRPTVERMNDFLRTHAYTEMSNKEREVLVKIVQTSCRINNWQLQMLMEGCKASARCTLSVGPTSNGMGNRFNVLASPGGRKTLSSRKVLPILEVRPTWKFYLTKVWFIPTLKTMEGTIRSSAISRWLFHEIGSKLGKLSCKAKSPSLQNII